ncbi:hypothetical protein LF1_06130 [Rubripirellula obstinata]|uniref:DUF2924 domain-containing protein n=1 Tax=Rubripirellula obstinata TaxID=406547 RepID=A0A5B1CAD7_9BACT|nr:DUF2924 domain-containing protein [Rubripirellula obstinata]KAA1258098.1 hypothetical protein LF1_06130 [Rubripirellula obstinata]
MSPELAVEIGRLEKMTVDQLVAKYEVTFGEVCRSRHKRYLIRRIAWRMQAKVEGGLSDRARKTANRLAATSDARQTPPRDMSVFEKRPKPKSTKTKEPVVDPRLPPPGNWIERQYKGRMISVLVLERGFEFSGKWYRSLSAIANEVCGTNYNGFEFFKLGKKPPKGKS